MALRILDWDLCMINVLDLLAQPHKNCLLKYVIEGDIKVMGRRGRRRKLLLDDLIDTGIY